MSAVGGIGAVQDIIALRQQVIGQSSTLQGLREQQSTDRDVAPSKPAGGGFADTLQSALGNVNATQLHSAEMTAAFERGEVTDVAQVMLARQEAGVAFEATLQVRNKLLSAYQEIMRMGV